MPNKIGDEIVQLVALFQQRWQCRFKLGELGLLRGNVGSTDIALGLLKLEQAEDLAVDADQLVRRFDLILKRRFLDAASATFALNVICVAIIW